MYNQLRERSPRERGPREERSLRNQKEGQVRSERLREKSPRHQEAPAKAVINTISRGFGGGGMTYSDRKRHLRTTQNVNMIGHRKHRSMPMMITI